VASEIEAMGQIQDAMKDLEPAEARRVLAWTVEWANEQLEAGFDAGLPRRQREGAGDDNGDSGGDEPQVFERIADLVDAASPSTAAEYALVGSYWFQVVQGAENVTSQQVNNELKDLGHGIKDITTAFNSLKERKPPLARQVQKAGSTRQARKRYRLTQRACASSRTA
jgi:hypothetical protein